MVESWFYCHASVPVKTMYFCSSNINLLTFPALQSSSLQPFKRQIMQSTHPRNTDEVVTVGCNNAIAAVYLRSIQYLYPFCKDVRKVWNHQSIIFCWSSIENILCIDSEAICTLQLYILYHNTYHNLFSFVGCTMFHHGALKKSTLCCTFSIRLALCSGCSEVKGQCSL